LGFSAAALTRFAREGWLEAAYSMIRKSVKRFSEKIMLK
jgi:hypothetical protein